MAWINGAADGVADGVAFTSLDKNIGNCFVKDRTLCDRVKMVLTLGTRAERNVGITEHI